MESGDTPGFVESVLSFGLQTLGLAGAASGAPSVKFDAGGGPFAPAAAVAGGGTVAFPVAGAAVGGGGGSLLNSVVSMMSGPGSGGPTPAAGGTVKGAAPPPGLTRQESSLVSALRRGEDVVVKSVDLARKLLANLPELKPFTSERFTPARPAPRGTYRGDLINTKQPDAPFIHDPKKVPESHAENPHYNLHFPSGKKSTIIIREPQPRRPP